ncbi:MAG: Gfo/Idh/MocA family oxidoreductase [Actinobacteria bacterium]|nr:Gfo/Idh/MocA family oxidoreductase [Actinomycetota bacterium]
MSSDVLRTVQVGIGTRGVPHLKAQLAQPQRFRVVGLVDVVDQYFSPAHALTGLPPSAGFRSLSDALAAVDCDAVSIVAPAMLHAKFIDEALGAGKHVLVEKPFTMALQDAERAVATARAKGLKLVVLQNDRLMEQHRWMRQAVADGRYGSIGTVAMLHYKARGKPYNLTPHMHLWQQGSHQLDTILAIVQKPPRRVQAVSKNPGFSTWPTASYFFAIIEFDGPVVASYAGASDARSNAYHLRVECAQAALVYTAASAGSPDGGLTVVPFQPGVPQPSFQRIDLPKPDMPKIDALIYERFWRAVVHDEANESAGHLNMDTVRVMDAIQRSTESGQPVTIA